MNWPASIWRVVSRTRCKLPVPFTIVFKVFQATKIRIPPFYAGSEKQIDIVCEIVVINPLLYPSVIQRLLRLRLPSQDTIFRYAFIKSVFPLCLSKCNKEHPVTRTIWNWHDALKTPSSCLGSKDGIRREDAVDFFPRILLVKN
jgi:hypothetical protein